MSTLNREELIAKLDVLFADRGERVHEWPADEAAAYRELGWEEGRTAARQVMLGKAADALLPHLRPESGVYDDHAVFEESLQSFLAAHPNETRSRALSPFRAGWAGRTSAARDAVGGFDDDDTAAVAAHIIDRLEHFQRENIDALMSSWATVRALNSQVQALKDQLREAGENPDDAPLHQRIGNQRRRIRELEAALAATRDQNG